MKTELEINTVDLEASKEAEEKKIQGVFLKAIGNLLWISLIGIPLLLTRKGLLRIRRQKWRLLNLSLNKKLKNEGSRNENSLMKKVKIKNKFLDDHEKL